MDWQIRLGTWNEVRDLARPVRLAVFVQEQNVPLELEWDEFDDVSLHAVAISDQGDVVGTGRLLPDGHIGRLAVLRSLRGKGIGDAILSLLMHEAKKRGDQAVILHAQKQAEAFYAKRGFTSEGQEFMEAGIPHIQMRCTLF